MEEQKDILGLLDMMVQPVFCVKDNIIIRANAPAQQLLLTEGQDVRLLLEDCAEEYAGFAGGCLYLTLQLYGQQLGVCIRRMQDWDVFEVEQGHDSSALQAMALAATSLRKLLGTMLADTAALTDVQLEPEAQQHLMQLNKGLHQILRLIGNMADAEHIPAHARMETVDVSGVLREIFEKAGTLLESAGATLHYQDLPETVYSLADQTMLERAVLNILSNAVKFSPKGSQILASLTRRGRTLRLTIQDSGSGIAQEVMGDLFKRYLRQAGIEDGRFGLGLGMHIVHAAAAHHGGALLVVPGTEGGTRIVMTLAIRQGDGHRLQSPIFPIDYTGGFDHALVELSDCLPARLFDGNI